MILLQRFESRHLSRSIGILRQAVSMSISKVSECPTNARSDRQEPFSARREKKKRQCLQRGRRLPVCKLMWAGLRQSRVFPDLMIRGWAGLLALPPPRVSHRTEVGAAFYDGVSCTTGRAAESMTVGQENHGESVVVCLSVCMQAAERGRCQRAEEERGEVPPLGWIDRSARSLLVLSYAVSICASSVSD